MRIPCRTWAYLAGLAFLALLLAPHAQPTARAEGLQRFTGYANPGTPSDKILASGVIESAADAPKAFGGSIYYMVLDRGEGRGDDTWGTGVKNFDTLFQPGLDDALKPSPGLDKKARYLYLYQVVNDRGSKSPIHEATIRLIIDPALITSWGYYSSAKKEKDKAPAGTGVGFAQELGADVKVPVAPVSTEHPVGPVKRPFVENAPHVSAPKPYEMSQIKVGNAPKAIADDPEGEDTGRSPVTVVLLKNADFQGAPEIHTQGRLITYDPNQTRDVAEVVQSLAPLAPVAYENFIDYTTVAPLPPTGADLNMVGTDLGMLGMPTAAPTVHATTYPGLRPVIFATPDADGKPDSRRSPAIRAVFYDVEGDVPLRQNERSVLFGFTSNFPPVFEATRFRGSAFAKEAPVDTAVPVSAANLTVDDSDIPTPVAFEQATAAVTGVGAPAGSLGGGETVGGAGAAPGGAVGGGFPGSGGGFGGGTGGGTGSGNGNGNQSQQQPNNITNNATAMQMQSQQKQQQQQQEQTGCPCPPGNIVPEPASLASALLGVPFLFLFLRRRKRTPVE